MYGGKTVENGNSDAEGRLVMADALARAGEDEPDLIVDVATLTGACVVALGERTAGLMANDDDTADRVLDAAEAAGEDVWQLPDPEARSARKLDSKVADIRSTGSDRCGGALVAAAFLREFVAEGTPWAHLDIAGPAFFDGKPYGYVSPGGTGFGVRTLIAAGPLPGRLTRELRGRPHAVANARSLGAERVRADERQRCALHRTRLARPMRGTSDARSRLRTPDSARRPNSKLMSRAGSAPAAAPSIPPTRSLCQHGVGVRRHPRKGGRPEPVR